MDLLQALGVLLLFTGPSLSVVPPSHDYWGEYGAYGQCSRTCGTGVAVRTRTCITSRTDGGHNCVGSSKSYRTCNTQACPASARDFREEQCSQFNRMDFQSKRFNWLPYYGAANPCELNCVPRGENFFYRQRPRVVDGTPCYVGRSDICVEGICRAISHGEILGMEDRDTSHLQAPRLRETLSYSYTYGVYSDCSASCNGGMQTRRVQCIAQDPGSAPHVVDNSYCIAQGLQRPASQQACNMHTCAEYTASGFSVCSVSCGEGQQTREVYCVGTGGERLSDQACHGLTRPPAVQACRKPACAEYSVSGFSVCSVSCGDGQQTREVFCVGARGERLGDQACHGLTRPSAVQACRKPACTTIHITWHINNFGLCSRRCGGGVRERRVACMDTNLNPYGDDRCRTQPRPPSIDTCNSQACPGAQEVPSVQDPRGHQRGGFAPFVPGESSSRRPQSNVDPYSTVVGPQCVQSYYGCCPDRHTAATGPRGEGCNQHDCVRSRYGCCLDGVTAAKGFGRSGCPAYQTPVDPSPPAEQHSGDVCSMARDEGPCDTWKTRVFYNSATLKCTRFWFGGCRGNGNNFASMAECERQCGGRAPTSTTPTPASRAVTRRGLRTRA